MMNNLIKSGLKSFIAGSIGALTLYSIQIFVAEPAINTTNSDGRKVQVWLDKVECEKEPDCHQCELAIKTVKKMEALRNTCPATALQWKYD